MEQIQAAIEAEFAVTGGLGGSIIAAAALFASVYVVQKGLRLAVQFIGNKRGW